MKSLLHPYGLFILILCKEAITFRKLQEYIRENLFDIIIFGYTDKGCAVKLIYDLVENMLSKSCLA